MDDLVKTNPLTLAKRGFTDEETAFLTKAMPVIQEKIGLYAVTAEGELASELDDFSRLKFKPSALCTLLLTFKTKGLNRNDFEEACHILQGYIENSRKGSKYVNHAAAIRNWVIDKVIERKRREADLERSEIYRDKAVSVMIGQGKQ